MAHAREARLARALALEGTTLVVNLWKHRLGAHELWEPNAMMLGAMSRESDVLEKRVGPETVSVFE